MSNLINIAYVDDHRIVREGIISLLQKVNPDLHVVFEANNGKDFIDKLQTSSTIPKIALIDLEMTVMNGYETIKWIHENKPEIKIMVLTQVIDELRVKKILKLGVEGYFEKNGDIYDLSGAIKIIDLGGEYFPRFVREAQSSLNNNKKNDYIKGIISGVYFSEEEIELIRLCYVGNYNKQIASILKIPYKSIEANISKIFRKMNVNSRSEMIHYAIKNKLIDLDH